MSSKKRFGILLGILIVMIVIVIIFSPKDTSITTGVKSGNFSISNLELAQSTGQAVNLKELEGVRINNGESTLLVEKINQTEGWAILYVNNNGNEDYLQISQDNVKKVDTNNDGTYDLSLELESVSDNIGLYVQSIDEKISFGTKLNDEIKGAVGGDNSSQSRMIFMTAVLILILMLVYMLQLYIFPMLKRKQIEGKQSNLSTLKMAFKKLKSEKDPARIKSLYSRIMELYKYMSDNEKSKAREIIAKAEKIYKAQKD